MISVSIVIVCMNNLNNLYPCLDSIRQYTKCSYEVFVTAYLFSEENLKKVKEDYPWVTFIESKEIRGFSENNNMALRQAKGKYCFVLNDDTEMRMPVVDRLLESIESLPEDVAIVSPITAYPDGRVQVCGRPYVDWKTRISCDFGFGNKKNIKKHCNQNGIFQTYNIIGAAFLIKTEIFKTLGWFDERYFFCPEDIALSDTLNRKGYKCYVNSDIRLIHYEGMSGKSLSKVLACTRPAQAKGYVIFYSRDNKVGYVLLSVYFWFYYLSRFIIHGVKCLFKKRPNSDYILFIGDKNTLATILTTMSPKAIFTKYYNRYFKLS